jgi:tetratricopeptide (TPR) repeat protein
MNSGSTEVEEPEPEAATGQEIGGASADDDQGADPTWPGLVDLLELRTMVLPALVTINRGHGRGTGFAIGGGLVVTAYHVTPQGDEATVVYQDGERAAVAEHVACDAARDLAVLRTNTKRERQTLRLAASLPAIGARVAAFKPGGGALQGTVTGIGKSMVLGRSAGCEMLRTTLNAVPGWSGGPVVNMQGEVVGINSTTDGPLFDATQGLKIATGSAAVPVTVLETLLAIVKLSEDIRSEPNNAAHRRDRAARYLSKGDFDKAIEDYTEGIRLEPKNAEAYCSRGKAHAERGEHEEAVADYTQAIARNRDFVEAYRGRAAAREKKADRDGAIADYLELIRLLPKAEADALEPRLVEIYKGRAKALTDVMQFDKAIADFSEVIRRRPNDAESLRNRARLYDVSGQSDQAIADYTEAIRLEPNEANLYRCRGIARAAKGEHDGAIADFTEVIRLNPKDAEAYCSRGAVHGGRHNFRRAIADFTEAIRLDPGLAKAYFDRGSAYEAQDDKAKAQADFEQATRLGYRPG